MKKPWFRPILVTLATTTAMLAQEKCGTIQGRVLDPGGAAVPGANVEVLNKATGAM